MNPILQRGLDLTETIRSDAQRKAIFAKKKKNLGIARQEMSKLVALVKQAQRKEDSPGLLKNAQVSQIRVYPGLEKFTPDQIQKGFKHYKKLVDSGDVDDLSVADVGKQFRSMGVGTGMEANALARYFKEGYHTLVTPTQKERLARMQSLLGNWPKLKNSK